MKRLVLSVFLVTIFCLSAIEPVWALKPEKEYKVTPNKFGMNFKEERITTPDGAILNAWFFDAAKKTTNWIVISGSGDGNMADNLELANQFLSAGYNVVTYDYRGYGASSDFEIDPDLFIYPQFIVDLNAVLDYLRKSRAITKFDLFGRDIGGGLSIGVGANRVETKKIIADGPWISLETMQRKLKDKKGKEVNLPFGYDKTYEPQFALDGKRQHLRGVMIIVSPNDELVTPQDTKVMKGVSNLFVVKESPSNKENFTTNKNDYFDKISKFLNS
ncbi:MAG: alpha/beta hydrolase [Nitrosopumilus sp.]|nr:alpha/beta hydrolase [Nitrosopumilus sp.]